MCRIYVYEDWTTEQLPRCFYVGFGCAARIKNERRNKHHSNIKEKYGIYRIVVLTTWDECFAHQQEIYRIALHKTYVYADDYVFGANYTQGGEGGSKSHLERAYIAIKTKEAMHRPDVRVKHLQGSISLEAQLKRTASLQGKKRSSKTLALMSAVQLRIHKENSAIGISKSKGASRRYANPIERNLQSLRMKEICQRSGVIEKRTKTRLVNKFRKLAHQWFMNKITKKYYDIIT